MLFGPLRDKNLIIPKLNLKPHLLSLTHVELEKVLFLNQIFEIEFLMDLHTNRLPEGGNHIFSVRSVCMCVCPCVSMCLLSA